MLYGKVHAAVYELTGTGVYAGNSLLRLQLVYLVLQFCDLGFQFSHFVFIGRAFGDRVAHG
ncbi:MAG: hypothetical protein COS99_05445 [Candidatus Omnitrophica bacterium CG07_land_8_20_14_0_80_42_15]|uniref:Uncharacterized protein n=1 Tax=Candidatus Aquitaenariimonas noxiae TaxID=1974741 RepID=A0A2J0KSA8_9BACT|nr:MAG: hypothetical protein COS99_05445 [Candidatus Omnitrophica bacterium CG07_land_8_20_14_0_80_42_15]